MSAAKSVRYVLLQQLDQGIGVEQDLRLKGRIRNEGVTLR
jgi:hypothetical protein